MFRIAIAALLTATLVATPEAAPARTQLGSCPDNPDALGTGRVLEVDVGATPRVGRRHFPATLPLTRNEVVLTFDDGPWPGTTPKVLEALRRECVRATFFVLGKHAEHYPALARQIFADGHTVAHHTYSHKILSRLPFPAAQAEIDRGVEEADYAVFGQRRSAPATPFFRFPGFAATPALLDSMQRRGIVVFGADVWASDWNTMQPADQTRLVIGRIEKFGGGIVLFHDTKMQTAAMMPEFLRELKRRGFSVVHVVPAGGRGAMR